MIVTKIYGDYEIDTVTINGVTYYKGNDFASALGYVNVHEAINRNVDVKIKLIDLLKNNKISSKRLSKINLNNFYITEIGCKKLIIKSTKPNTLEIAKLFGVSIFEKVEVIESEIIRKIMKAFSSEKMEYQKKCGKYKIDLYFTKYKIAIECDEDGHNRYNEECEIERQNFIEEKLECSFLRFNPNAKDFNLYSMLGNISHKIIETIKCS